MDVWNDMETIGEKVGAAGLKIEVSAAEEVALFSSATWSCFAGCCTCVLVSTSNCMCSCANTSSQVEHTYVLWTHIWLFCIITCADKFFTIPPIFTNHKRCLGDCRVCWFVYPISVQWPTYLPGQMMLLCLAGGSLYVLEASIKQLGLNCNAHMLHNHTYLLAPPLYGRMETKCCARFIEFEWFL